MKHLRICVAAAGLLMSLNVLAGWIPSEKYANWISTFQIDKTWHFENGKHGEGVGGSVHSGTSTVEFPGTIAWCFMSWDERNSNSDDHNMDWIEVYLRNGNNDNDKIKLVGIYISTNEDNDYWPRQINNGDKGDKTYLAQYRWYNYADGAWFCYMVTEYSAETRALIERAKDNLQIIVRTRWDDDHWNTYTRETTVNYSDRQFIPDIKVPTVTNVEWTVHDSKTAVKYTRTIPDGCTFRLREKYDNKTVFEATDSNKNTSVTDYTYPFQQSAIPSVEEMHKAPLSYECFSDKTYTMNQSYYLSAYSSSVPTRPALTRTLSSKMTTFTVPQFAQALDFSGVDKGDGTIGLKWDMEPCNGSEVDESAIIIERATDANFSQDVSKYEEPYSNTQAHYEKDIPFVERDNGKYTFYFRIYRKNATFDNAILTDTCQVTANTNYAKITSFYGEINKNLHPVLHWDISSGVCTENMQLRLKYNNITNDIDLTQAKQKGQIEITDALPTCDSIVYSAQIIEGTKVHGAEEHIKLMIPNTMGGIITSYSVSKGFYNDRVQLRWKIDAEQHNFKHFQISRKENNTNEQAVVLGTTNFKSGVLDYAFEDVNCVPGVYYQYYITGYTECDGNVDVICQVSSVGFAQPYGVVSGQITYSGNQGVSDVSVSVIGEDARRSRSLRFLSKDGARLEIPDSLLHEMTGEHGTIEYFMRDDKAHDARFNHIAITFEGTTQTVYINGEPTDPSQLAQRASTTLNSQLSTLNSEGKLVFGGDGFDGFIDEIRVWNICRSQVQIKRTMNIYLSGEEKNLTGYYRCDDEIENELFDISRNGTTFNERHLKMYAVVPDQDNIPTNEQLSLKAITDKNGNYLINNVPYTVGGSLYNVIPTLGVHEFSPSSHPLFFNKDAATHNSIDFTDKSSFTVTGKVTFENTDYPVKGCQFYVDGQLCTMDGTIIESDAEGNYSIQVPIGEHAITVKKDGHTFVNEGRYPADPNGTGLKQLFDAPRTGVQFFDNTTVLVVGRVAGGEDEAKKVHGFELGVANIGQARIVITPPEDIYNLNLSETDSRVFASPDSLRCHSQATVKKKNGGDAHSVTILTDNKTGEFAVALPPIDFEISEIKVVNNPDIIFDLGQFENLKLGSDNIRETKTDTFYTDSVNYKTVTYFKKLDAIHYALPELSISQWGSRQGEIGEKTYYITLPSGQVDTIPLFSVTDNKLTYTMGVPCFLQDKAYSWTIHAFETYINYDGSEPVYTHPPMRNAIVTIENELGDKEVAAEDGYSIDEKGDSMQVVAGQIISLAQNQVLLDSSGLAQYIFLVGEPNLVDPYTYNVNITYEAPDHSRIYSWSENGKFKGLIFGSRTSGSNFVTDGPDNLLFVLRDPPGGKSYATWEKGQSIITSTETTHEQNRGTEFEHMFAGGLEQQMGLGAGVITFTTIEQMSNAGFGTKYDGLSRWSHSRSYEVTTNTTISTKPEYPFVGTTGDVFVGAGTNRIFGNARKVTLERVQDHPAKYNIVVKDVIATGSTFKTSFAYSTYEIENDVIPNYIKQRNALLQYVDKASYNSSYPNMTNEPIYITTLSKDDPRFGSNNYDKDVWGSAATPIDSLGGPSYIMIPPAVIADTVNGVADQICHLNNQIRRWQDVLATNEKNKVDVHHSTQKFNYEDWDKAAEKASLALSWRNTLRDPNATACRSQGEYSTCTRAFLEEDYRNSGVDTAYVEIRDYYNGGWLLENYSLGGGATISSSRTEVTGKNDGFHEEDGCKVLLKVRTTAKFNSIGFTIKNDTYAGYNHTYDEKTEKLQRSAISYTLETNDYEYMSIDVYSSPDGFGPIFSTRGGQTYCPYEGEERTKYFEPGQHELHTATVNMEQPQIRVETPSVTDVPIGGKAIYTLTLANVADVAPDYFTWLKLYAAGDYNPKGAQIQVDGAALTDAGRLIKFYPSQPIIKTLVLTQSDLGVLDYDSLAIILTSDCNLYEQADTIWLSAHFVPTCSEISLKIDNTTINTSTGDTLPITINGYDRNFRNFKSIRLQYRQSSENDWHLIREFCANESDTVGGQKTLITGSAIHYSLAMPDTQFPDGEYEFRAVTACTFGNEEIPNESAIITVIKDMQRPVSLGLPSPINGIYTSDNQIYVDFNEPILTGRVRDKNISVQGVLNAHNVGDHAVALQINEAGALCEAEYNFNNTDFTFEFWYNYLGGDGLVLCHAQGSTIGLTLAILDGRFTAQIGNFEARAKDTLPTNKWCYITVEYEADKNNGKGGTLTAHCAYDSYEMVLFDHVRAPQYDIRGNILLGGFNNCMMHDFAIWNIQRDWSTSLSERNKRKDSYTDGLLTYWPMDEGEGFVARDIIRNRHLQLEPLYNTWWYNNNNIALTIPAGQVAKMDLSECSIPKGEDYVFECWFRMTQDGTLLALSDSSLIFEFNVNCMLLTVGNETKVVSLASRVVNGTWHHLAINYRHNTTPIFMMDGQQLDVTGIKEMPAFASSHIIFSSEQSEAEVGLDEIRLWNAYIMPQNIALNRRNELKGDEAGLVAYYPMERDTVDEAMQPTKVFSLKDRKSQHTLQSPVSSSTLFSSTTQPALRKQRPVEEVKHTYTPSAQRLVINVTEPAARIEGCTLEFEVTDLVDEHGNYSTPIHWTTYVNRNQLLWTDEAIHVSKTALKDTTLTLSIENNSGKPENWYITHAPHWLELSETSGILQPLQKKQITATIQGSLAIGNYEQNIYLMGNESVMDPLHLTVRVNAEKPDWKVNPAEFEYSMNIIATAKINTTVADDSEDLVAAFIGDQLVGLGSPQLFSAYRCHYIMMNIYANLTQAEKDSINAGLSLNKQVTFKYWDASTGLIYTDVRVTLPETPSTQQTADILYFAGGKLVGSMQKPIVLKAGKEAEQTIPLVKGWNWISFNVIPKDVHFNSVLQDMMDNINIIKSKEAFAQISAVRDSLRGSLKVMDCIKGYKLHVNNPYSKTVTGSIINPLFYGIELKGNNNWTWIGYLPQMSLDVNTALANINPSEGDIIKSQAYFATWDGYQWVGPLKTMSPGNAYLYCNIGEDKTLYYPSLTRNAAPIINSSIHHSAKRFNSQFTPVEPGQFPGNMTITAVVKDGDRVVEDAEVGIFAGDECRAAAFAEDGLWFLTIPGDKTETLTIQVATPSSIYYPQSTLTYIEDAMIGTVAEPYIIQIGNDSGWEKVEKGERGDESQKIFRNGLLFIKRNGKTYNAQGAKIH